MRKLFDNPKPVLFAIVLFLVGAFSYRACSAQAHLELGPTYTGELNGGVGLTYTERLGDWDVGTMLMSEQTWDGQTTGNNGGFFASYVFERPASFWRILPDELHLGPSVWIKTDDRLIGCNLGWNMGVRYYITDHWHLGIRHWSNAGTCKPNRGQDLGVALGWRFK